jgi:hypothetical protein
MNSATEIHPEWQGEPRFITSGFLPLVRNGRYIDRYVSYIVGRGPLGRRYCRAVEVTGRQIEDGSAEQRRQQVLIIVMREGPYVCTLLDDAGGYPRESEQVEL